jgi:hypothetical protein
MVFSKQSVSKCYKAGQFVSSESVSERLVGELVSAITAGIQLLWEAGSWGTGIVGNPEEGERPPLEAVTRRLVKTQHTEKT